ncbi:MAG: hypothetical protein QF652_06785 [Dehalococcoidia bacterium]|nr:hypothetical protein [Dehalococcoidia bacterium]
MTDTRKPYVYVTLEGPDDGGDFGRNTPGTRSGGIQEAVDYAHANFRDVYVFGGRGGMHDTKGYDDNVYLLHETLRIPWSQDFRFDGGNYVLAYTQPTGDAILVDSQMNCRYKFGLIGSMSRDGAGVRIRPVTPGPDDFVTVVACVFEFSAVVSQGEFGDGIVIDPTHGGVSGTRFLAEETNTMARGLYVVDDGSGHGFNNNVVEIMFTNQNHAVGDAVGMRVGDPGSRGIQHNTFRSALHAPRGVHIDPETKAIVPKEGMDTPQGAMGAQIHAHSNVFHLAFYGTWLPGKNIVFEEGARDNTVHAFNLPHGITNNAENPTNRVVTNSTVGFAVETPAFPSSGSGLANTSSHTVEVFVTRPGNVSAWTIQDANGAAHTFEGELAVGQSFPLDPGDRVTFDYADRPDWVWKAMR